MAHPQHHLHYVPCRGCGAHCDRAREATEERPCWGTVLFEILPHNNEHTVPPTRHRCAGHESDEYRPLRMAPENSNA